jgi:hypothetical protein
VKKSSAVYEQGASTSAGKIHGGGTSTSGIGRFKAEHSSQQTTSAAQKNAPPSAFGAWTMVGGAIWLLGIVWWLAVDHLAP